MKISKEKLRSMIQESVRRQLRAKLLNEGPYSSFKNDKMQLIVAKIAKALKDEIKLVGIQPTVNYQVKKSLTDAVIAAAFGGRVEDWKEREAMTEGVNVRAGTDIILAAEKEWHDFVYNVIAKQLGLVSVEKMPDDLGNKILAVIKSEWPKIKDAVSSTAEKLSGFPKDGEDNSVTHVQNQSVVQSQPGMMAEHRTKKAQEKK